MTWNFDITAAPRGEEKDRLHRHDEALLHATEALWSERKEFVTMLGMELAVKAYLDKMRFTPPASQPRRMALTKSQKDLLDFIQAYVAQNDGVSPFYDEMKEAVGLNSKSGIHRLVTGLEERGCIRRLPNRARSIAVEGA